MKKKYLKNVHKEKVFYLPDGSQLKNLKQLARSLKNMSSDFYNHHVTDTKNDFANWIEHVIGDMSLAKKLRKLKSRNAMLKAVESRIAQLSGRTKTDMGNVEKVMKKRAKKLAKKVKKVAAKIKKSAKKVKTRKK